MSIAFIPKSLSNQVANLPILSIYASAHPPTPVAGPSGSTTNQKTNHWVLYLAISQTESLRLDPSPGSDNTMTLIISKKSYLYSNNAVKTVQLTCVENLTVGNVVEYLRSSNYIKYRFSTSGQGCRYWVNSVISLFSPAYITVGSQVQEARDALQVVWDTHGKASDIEQTGIVAGAFYSDVSYGEGASSGGLSSTQPSTESNQFPAKYTYVQNKQYFWYDMGAVTPLPKCPKNEWVYNGEG